MEATLAQLTAKFHTWPAATQRKVLDLAQQLADGQLTSGQVADLLDEMQLPGVRSVTAR